MICECEESPGVFGCAIGCPCRCHELERERDEARWAGAKALSERDAERARVEKLKTWLDAITCEFESAVQHHENRGKGGQTTGGRGGDFGHVPPSTVGRMRWWAREFRAVLADTEVKP